ncbi:signal peptidase I [Candidatus Falkowbacteria bacterium]|nr:signal peptidase I [Candidatus Falkowbacteria bacterium]
MSDFLFQQKKFWQNEKVQEAVDFAVEIVKIVLISLAIIVPVRYFLIQPFYVKGASMEPNFYNHEYLIIDEISYRFDNPQRGDIVVFRPPGNPGGDFFIKLIIGLPGETVDIQNGKIKISNTAHPDGAIVDETFYLDARVVTHGNRDNSLVQLGPDQYFVMGDNRASSLDSRTFGSIQRDSIVGRVWLRGWPFNRVTVFATPPYNI